MTYHLSTRSRSRLVGISELDCPLDNRLVDEAVFRRSK